MRSTKRLLAIVKSEKFLTSGNPTGLTGLLTHPAPRSQLLYLYSSTLNKLSQLPDHSVYRKSAEAITKQRLSIIQAAKPPGYEEWEQRAKKKIEQHPEVFGKDVEPSGVFVSATLSEQMDDSYTSWDQKKIAEIEDQIGGGLIEEIIQVAEGEDKLVDTILESRSWDELEEKAPQGSVHTFSLSPHAESSLGQWDYFSRDQHNTAKTSIMGTQMPKVAFAGLGAMGFGMAAHLVKSGFPVTGFDVYQPSLDKFTQQAAGASSAKTPREAAQNVEFFICMVATSVQATPLLFDHDTGAVVGLRKNGTIIMCSTVAPAYIAEIHSRLREIGRSDIRLIDSPVSGGAGRAADGTLSIFASGEWTHLANADAILKCMSGKLYEIPGGLGGGSKAKLIHQIFAGINIAVTNEAMGLAASAGLDTSDVRERVSKGEGWSWMFENRTPKMLDPNLPPYSAVTIIAKDAGIITQTGREAKFPLPLLTVAEQLYLTAISAGWGSEDDCVIVRLYLPGQNDLVAKRAGSPSDAGSRETTWETIQDLLIGVHLASITEAMSFCEYLGVDTEMMYDIVSNAAGSTRVFEKFFERVKGNGWKLKGIADAESIRERLVSDVSLEYSYLQESSRR
ncbi:MAG: hypothetical protein Q9220_004805 [cf. Caloplaca sp. 1 TL-2023]